MTLFGTCTHEKKLWDIDEWKCLTCGISLTYPPHLPTAEEMRDRAQTADLDSRLIRLGESSAALVLLPESERLNVSCVVCRSKGWDSPDEKGNAQCEGCAAVLAVYAGEGWKLPPLRRWPKLVCTCCAVSLPVFDFAYNRRATARSFRHYTCRRCKSFRARIDRQVNGETVRANSRARAAQVYAKRAAGILPQLVTTPKIRAGNIAAKKRHTARTQGRAVPLQSRGRPVALIKPLCRIRLDCPLEKFCSTDKQPTDTPLKSQPVGPVR